MKYIYDLIFGMGDNCEASLMLRENGLQICSFPFDWLANSKLGENLDILTNKFNNFFNKEDLVYVQQINTPEQYNIEYRNKRTNLSFKHDFPVENTFDEQYPICRKKYNRRCERLLNKIYKSKKVLIVFRTSKQVKTEDIISEIRSRKDKIQTTFPDTHIDYLYLINSNNKYTFEDKSLNLKIISDNLSVENKIIKFFNIRIRYKKYNSKKILKNYKLRKTISDRIKNFIYFSEKFSINLIPDKDIQKKLRYIKRFK